MLNCGANDLVTPSRRQRSTKQFRFTRPPVDQGFQNLRRPSSENHIIADAVDLLFARRQRASDKVSVLTLSAIEAPHDLSLYVHDEDRVRSIAGTCQDDEKFEISRQRTDAVNGDVGSGAVAMRFECVPALGSLDVPDFDRSIGDGVDDLMAVRG